MPGVSDWGRTGGRGAMLKNSPVNAPDNTIAIETQRPGTKDGHVSKRAPSRVERVKQRRAALRKMRLLKRKRRELCTMPRNGQRETEPQPLRPSDRVKAEQWEQDSGFSSEVSPPVSGRSSPFSTLRPGQLVSMDCEMVGTGPEGRCSELARCSLVNYYGEVLFDKYVQPQQPVKDYRTRWSGICKHHLLNAVPFQKARTEILQILDGKIVVGHALHNDFRALGFIPPRHMIRDTSCTHLLRQLSNMPANGSASLKSLAKTLLNRNIQMGRVGHSSVEDAVAALDLYKLVEEQWEREILSRGQHLDSSPAPEPDSSSSHFMQDQYWPADLMED
ncbi:hypothetical protein JZ751_019433 [Albula glossodonta]|uniref:Exonuclease domain-containing protein n=1 Tax=Albula glossodonta TaxID=121402 RepID=A0A8T2NM58_9TELE|nr:hypothetical protein JZ751_019433 [Albula glossodonta]